MYILGLGWKLDSTGGIYKKLMIKAYRGWKMHVSYLVTNKSKHCTKASDRT